MTLTRRRLLATGATALGAPFILRGEKATAFALIGDRYHNGNSSGG
jgi:hypothetical protein